MDGETDSPVGYSDYTHLRVDLCFSDGANSTKNLWTFTSVAVD
jgi:hypothetical protein